MDNNNNTGGGNTSNSANTGDQVKPAVPSTGPGVGVAPSVGAKDTAPMSPVEKRLLELETEMGTLKEGIKERDGIISMLESVADKGRVESFRQKRGFKPSSIVKVSFFQKKMVVAWKMLQDDVWRDSDGIWHEKQVVQIITEDNKEHNLDYVDFQRLLEKKPATIIDRKKEDIPDFDSGTTSQKEIFTLKLEDREEPVRISGTFIN